MKKRTLVVATGTGVVAAVCRWYPDAVRVVRSTVVLNNVDISSVIQPKKRDGDETHAPLDAGVT